MARSVLVVDDDASFRHLARRVLTSWGLDVVGEAGNVREAVDRARKLEPDSVLADIGLPDGDGFALTEQIVEFSAHIRVVLISSDDDPANGPAAQRAGATAFLPKDELSSADMRRLLEEA